MLKWNIDETICNKYSLTIDEYLLLLFLARDNNIDTHLNSLLRKNLIIKSPVDDTYIVTTTITKKVQEILLESDKRVKGREDRYTLLANKLRELYPKGTKPGTNYQWRGSTAEIAKKLKNLVVKYDCTFTDEEAIEATQNYINSFNSDYRYMKLLKYFLLKTPVNNNGDVEIESDFMTFLQNKEDININNNDWTVELT